MPDIREQVSTICGVCGHRREMLTEALKVDRQFQCAGCGCQVNLDDYQLSRLLNANDRTPHVTVTLTEVTPRHQEEGRLDIKSGGPIPARS